VEKNFPTQPNPASLPICTENQFPAMDAGYSVVLHALRKMESRIAAVIDVHGALRCTPAMGEPSSTRSRFVSTSMTHPSLTPTPTASALNPSSSRCCSTTLSPTTTALVVDPSSTRTSMTNQCSTRNGNRSGRPNIRPSAHRLWVDFHIRIHTRG
jgi:hypothetical protein